MMHRSWAVGLLWGLLVPLSCFATGAEPEVLYHVRPRDTFIGLGQRLLVDPHRWNELRALNRNPETTRLRPGSELHIPVSWLKWKAETGSVRDASGEVTADGRAVRAGQSLAEGATIETGADGSVALTLPDGSALTLAGGSAIHLLRMRSAPGTDAPDVQLGLDRGHAEVSAQKHRDVGRFEIRTPTAVAGVRGTRFRTHFHPDDASATEETLEGRVGVEGNEQAIPVEAGFGTRAESGRAPHAPVALLAAPELAHLPDDNATAMLDLEFDPVPGAQRYRVQISRSAEFLSFERDATTAEPRASFAGLADGAYWLRIRAIDSLGIEGRDAVHAIRQHRVPPAAELAEPAPDADILGSDVQFAWTNVASNYRLQLALDNSMAEPVLDRQDLGEARMHLHGLAIGRYCWRVGSLDAAGQQGLWSAVKCFRIEPEPVAANPGGAGSSRMIRLEWPQQSGFEAILQVADDEAFSRIRVEQRSATGSAQLPRLPAGKYFVRLRWTNEAGYQGPFGPVTSIREPPSPWRWLFLLPVGLAPLL